MEAFLRQWIEWPSVAAFISTHSWVWPLCETFHFFGIILLIGGVGMFDLRVLGMGRGLPPVALKRFVFFGIILLIGGVGMFDLRVLGMARGLPPVALKRFVPWGVYGFILCVVTGIVFVTGMRSNVPMSPYDVIKTDVWLQLKLVFIVLAGVNLLAFYVTGMSRAVDDLGPEDDAPGLAKLIAGASLFLWLGVIYFGRLIPEALG
jgi:hypothetical protein